MDNVYTLNEIVQRRLRKDMKTYICILFIYTEYFNMTLCGLIVLGINCGT